MKRTSSCCLLGTLLCLLAVAAGRAADDFRSARVSNVHGNLALRGIDEDDVSNVEVNAIVREGDVLWTDRASRAELELERGSWLRLAEDTKVEVRRLGGGVELRLWTGSVYLDVSDRVEGRVRLITPVGEVEVERNSVVRVDLGGTDRARTSVLNGAARVVGTDGAPVALAAGDRAYVEENKPIAPERFNRDDLDNFDRYQRARVDYYINRPLPRELDRDIIGARELNDHGSWVDVEGSRYWQPRAGPDWRPYSTGYWSYVSGCGYSWVDYAPWAYTTSHYGSWLYRPSYGWLWSVGYNWAPAHVYWSSWGSSYGWAPLDPYGRPCYYGGGNFNSFNLAIDFRSWSFCDKDKFHHSRHHRKCDDDWGKGHGGHDGHGKGRGDGHGDGHGGGKGKNIHSWNDVAKRGHSRNDFKPFRDAKGEIGIPREHVRGVVLTDDGRPARDNVVRLEDRIPERRRTQIGNRFGVSPMRDREQALRPSSWERLQKDPQARVSDDRILRGSAAVERFQRQAAATRYTGDSSGFRRGGESGFRTPPGADARGPLTGGPDGGDRNPGAGGRIERPGGGSSSGAARPGAPGGERDNLFRRGGASSTDRSPPGGPSGAGGDDRGAGHRENPLRRGATDPGGNNGGRPGGFDDRRSPSERPSFDRGSSSGGADPPGSSGGDRPSYRDYVVPRGSSDRSGNERSGSGQDDRFRRSAPGGDAGGGFRSLPDRQPGLDRRGDDARPSGGSGPPSSPGLRRGGSDDPTRPTYRDYRIPYTGTRSSGGDGGGFRRSSPDSGAGGGNPAAARSGGSSGSGRGGNDNRGGGSTSQPSFDRGGSSGGYSGGSRPGGYSGGSGYSGTGRSGGSFGGSSSGGSRSGSGSGSSGGGRSSGSSGGGGRSSGSDRGGGGGSSGRGGGSQR